MKLTQEVIDKIQEAMNHTKMNGDMNWLDGDEIDLSGCFFETEFLFGFLFVVFELIIFYLSKVVWLV